MMNMPTELTGQRVLLLPLETVHTEELFKAGGSEDIWKYMPLRVASLEDAKTFVQQALAAKEQGTEYPFVVFDRQLGRIVGSTRYCDISPANRSLEIGWTWYSPEVWRTRVNTECKYLLLRYGFETLDLLRVQLKTDGRNLRSQQAIERIGGVREGVLRRHRIMYDGYVRDSVYFSILAEEWPTVKERLQAMLRQGE